MTIEQLEQENHKLRKALERCAKHCYCNRLAGFDYGEKHPRLGVCPTGRWLTVKEMVIIALNLGRRAA